MKLENLLWSEIQEIKIAIEKTKEERWKSLTERISKKVTHKQIKEFKKDFDSETNMFLIEGRCNRILKEIQRQDDLLQKEMEKKQ